MDPLTTAAASGMRSRMEALDVLANNIANTSVPGFKIDRELYNVYHSSEAFEDTDQPVIQKNWTDFAQGFLGTTGSPLNLALEGAGFFVANSPSGKLYTRTGALKISKENELVTAEGYTVQGQDGKPIQLDPLQPIEIDVQGVVRQSGTDVGQLAVVAFKEPGILSKRGSTYFSSQAAPEPSSAAVRQGQLEGANGEPAESAVRLVSVMREFESLKKALSVGLDMNRRAIEDVAKVS
ncbi:MAG TPA: flagellar hook basal-body protein [Bryobacteraceae bacterium]|nr:flagellar hook basal-body protein [Bryobacteraceae bacterium]